jgi:hypothetical protein
MEITVAVVIAVAASLLSFLLKIDVVGMYGIAWSGGSMGFESEASQPNRAIRPHACPYSVLPDARSNHVSRVCGHPQGTPFGIEHHNIIFRLLI